jgi:hypothetical protein
MLSPLLVGRLASQLEATDMILRGASDAELVARPAGGSWSAHENLAHCGRVQEVFSGRLDRILSETRPELPRYRAEDDTGWPAWAAEPPRQALARLRGGRGELVARLSGLGPPELRRTGVHSRFGELDVPGWLEFLLVHEAHHLYVVMHRLADAKHAGVV